MTLRFVRLLALIAAIAVFNCDGNFAIASDKSAPVSGNQTCGIAALFDDRIVASNVAVVRQHAARLPDAARFDHLLQWVLPSPTHFTIRMNGEFTQTNPAPLNSSGVEGDDLRGGVLVSPVFDLLDLVKKTNRLDEFLKAVEAIPDSIDEEQQRARSALLVLIQLEMGKQDDAAKEADRLLKLVAKSTPDQLSAMWPETLVVHRAVVHLGGNVAVDDLLSYLFVQRSQREKPQGLLAWHNQIASLAGRNGHTETLRPDPNVIVHPDLSQWVPVSRLRSMTRGLGFPQALWGRQGHRIDKTSGHDEDYLFFRSPLLGNYEMECDMSPSATQAMVAGTLLGNDGDLSKIWTGTMRDGARMQPIDFRFSGFGSWVRYRAVVRNHVCTTYLDGLTVRTEQLEDNSDPWISVRSWSRSHGSARDIRISGSPTIPDSIVLSASKDLRGWYPYHDESVGTKGARWEHLGDPESTGQIYGMALAPHGTFFQSLLTYQRPLEDVGSVSYEFFYQPGITETQPAIDRMALVLKPEGVRIHWITDNQWDTSDVSPDNLTDVPGNHRGPAALPLKADAWNRMTVAVNGSKVTLNLNDQLVYEFQLHSNSSRTFGLFHFADQTEVRVRNVTMSGNWPKRLTAVAEQELADQSPIELDRDLPKLKAIFRHDFAKDGLSSRYLATADTDQQGKVTSRPDGVFVIRPGGGPWLDQNLRLPFTIYGDFDIELAFDHFKAQGDKDGCIMMVLQLDDDKQRQCRILRIRTEAQLQQLHASMSVIHADGGRSYAAINPTFCDASQGRLRMARRGTTLSWLVAENDSKQFRLLGTEEVSDGPSVPDTLMLHALCNGSGETQVLWKSMTLRAERMTLPPDPTERPPISLYSMNSDGTNLQKLAAPLKGFIQIGSAEWSGDGAKLVADMSNGGTETSRIVVINSDGSDMKGLGPGCMPSLSPDQREIVFSQPATGIMRMKVDGSERTLVDSSGWGTQWSPDGKYIAWASGSNLVLLDPKTNKRRQLLTAEQSAQLGYVYWNIGWSLDGKSIAFKARKADRTGDVLAVADVDSAAGFRIIYAGSDRINEDFTWHPNGRDVVVSLLIPPSKTSKLFIINRDTLAAPKLLPGQPADWNILGSDWSPDGATIAFSAGMLPQPVEWPSTD